MHQDWTLVRFTCVPVRDALYIKEHEDIMIAPIYGFSITIRYKRPTGAQQAVSEGVSKKRRYGQKNYITFKLFQKFKTKHWLQKAVLDYSLWNYSAGFTLCVQWQHFTSYTQDSKWSLLVIWWSDGLCLATCEELVTSQGEELEVVKAVPLWHVPLFLCDAPHRRWTFVLLSGYNIRIRSLLSKTKVHYLCGASQRNKGTRHKGSAYMDAGPNVTGKANHKIISRSDDASWTGCEMLLLKSKSSWIVAQK